MLFESGAGRVGSYSPVVLTEILKRTASESRSGALHVVSGPSVKSVHFDKGTVRFAASNVRKDRLGESMLAHEFISRDVYTLASEKMQNDRCRFGEALLQLGRVTEDQLNRELAIQVQRIVLSLFRVAEGTYSYEEASASTGALPFGLSVPSLLLKGLRAVDDGKLVLSALPPAAARVRRAAAPPFRVDLKKLSSAEITVLGVTEDGMEIGEIVRRCGLAQSAAFKSCFVLFYLGLLELVPSEEPAVAGQPTQPTQPIEEDERFRSLIVDEYERLGSATERELLGVPNNASLEALHIAYDASKAEWNEVREVTRDPGLLDKIDSIEFRTAAAFAHLRAEKERSEGEQRKPDPQDFARRQRLEQLDRDARLHVQVKDWNGAVSLLHELIAFEPERAEYQAMMGKAMQHHPQLRKNAEQHFLEAVALAPHMLSYRLALARYYLSLRNRSRALGEIQTVLAMDPGNQEALRLTASMRDPSPMQKLFKKVFR